MLLEQGIMLFNEKPKNGIKFCIHNKILEDNHTEISKFLISVKGLSKFAIGEYLSEPDEFN